MAIAAGRCANGSRWSEDCKRLWSLISEEMPEPVTTRLDDDNGLFEFLLGIGFQDAFQFGMHSRQASRRQPEIDDPGADPLDEDEVAKVPSDQEEFLFLRQALATA